MGEVVIVFAIWVNAEHGFISRVVPRTMLGFCFGKSFQRDLGYIGIAGAVAPVRRPSSQKAKMIWSVVRVADFPGCAYRICKHLQDTIDRNPPNFSRVRHRQLFIRFESQLAFEIHVIAHQSRAG